MEFTLWLLHLTATFDILQIELFRKLYSSTNLALTAGKTAARLDVEKKFALSFQNINSFGVFMHSWRYRRKNEVDFKQAKYLYVSYGIRTHNHSVRKRTLNHLTTWPVFLNGWVFIYELSGCGFESCCCHINFRYRACFEQRVPWHSGNYRLWIHSETRPWHDNNIQLREILIPFERRGCIYSTLIYISTADKNVTNITL